MQWVDTEGVMGKPRWEIPPPREGVQLSVCVKYIDD